MNSILIEKYNDEKFPHNNLLNFLKSNFVDRNEFCLIKNKTVVFYIMEKDQIIGVICILNDNDLTDYLEEKNPEYIASYTLRAQIGAHIYNFATLGKYRNMGIGKKLINMVLFSLKKLGYEYCHTHVDDNSSSNYLFRKKGFFETNKIPVSNNKFLINLNFWL